MRNTAVRQFSLAYSAPPVAAPSAVRKGTFSTCVPAGRARGFQSSVRSMPVKLDLALTKASISLTILSDDRPRLRPCRPAEAADLHRSIEAFHPPRLRRDHDAGHRGCAAHQPAEALLLLQGQGRHP